MVLLSCESTKPTLVHWIIHISVPSSGRVITMDRTIIGILMYIELSFGKL
jgi:hypothetical protein